ncbi:MAG: imelysin family protein [Hyphomicrobium sp.]
MILSKRALWTALLAAVMAAGCWGAKAAEPQSHYTLVAHTLETHIVPRVEALQTAAAVLPAKVEAVCKDGGDKALADLKTAFGKSASAWAGVEFLRFGPLGEAGRRERFSFWPDPRGVMDRQLRQLIAAQDPNIIAPGSLAKQSAAVQGLPALESLMTDKDTPLGPGEAAAYRCQLAGAIAGNLAALSGEIRDGWLKEGGFKDRMLRPGSDNPTYKEPGEAATELLKALLTGLQFVNDVELKPKLEKAAAVAPLGPFAKLGLQSAYFQAGITSLNQFYDAMNLESYLAEDKAWIKGWAKGAWRTFSLSDGAGGAAPGVSKGDAPKLRQVVSQLGGLRQLIGKEMASAAGLAIGFNELDGD